MSYSPQILREKFSDGQKTIMYTWIIAHNVASGFQASFPYLNFASPNLDVYEPDNFLATSNPQINFGAIQHRSFHKVPNGKRNDEDLYYSLCDQDFVKLVVPHNGYKVNIYTAAVPGRPQVNTEIFLFSTNGTTILTSNDDISSANQHSEIMEYALNAGTYWLKIVNKGSNSGEYLLHLERCAEICCFNDLIGTATDVNNSTGNFNIGVRGNAPETDEFFGNSISINGADFGCNASIPLGFGGLGYGIPYSVLNLTICNNANLTIANGEMKVGHASSSRTSNVKFANNTKLLLGNNATLRIDEGSRVVFEAGSILEIQGAAQIELSGPNAVLVIRGALVLTNNSTFTYSGNGYILWENTSLSPQITAGTNAKFKIEGSSINNKLMELTDNTVLNFPAALEFELKNGKVFCAPGSGINISGKTTLFNSWFAGTGGATQPFNGVTVSSTKLNDIRFSYFDYANTGLNLIQTGNPNMPTLTGNRYRWCGIGLKIHDKGAVINGNHFISNNNGLTLFATSSRINVSGSNFEENFNAIKIYGTNPSPIQITSSSIVWTGGQEDHMNFGIECDYANLELRGNTITGYKYGVSMGSGYLRAACNTITGSEIGIEAWQGTTVNIANEARNNISDNGTGIALDRAWLKLQNGKNRLDGNIDRSIAGIIEADIYVKQSLLTQTGTFHFYKYNFSNNLLNSPIIFPSTHNGQVGGQLINGTPDVYTCYQEYLLNPYNPSEAFVSYSDNNFTEPLFFECSPCTFDYITCSQASPPWYTELYPDLMPGTDPTQFILTTPRFQQIELKDAIRQALDHLTFDYEYPQLDLLALAELKDILTYNYGADKDEIVDLLGSVRHAMTQGLANAYTNGLLPIDYGVIPNELSEYAIAILSELDALIDQDPNDYDKVGYYTIEKAQVYRLAGHYSSALDELNSTNASYAPNKDFWLCICEEEWDFLSGNISVDQFIENTSQCNDLFQARRMRMRSMAREGIYQKPNLTQLVISPNPSSGVFTVTVPLSEIKAQIEIFSPQGSIVKVLEVPASISSMLVDNLDLLPGTYLVKYNGAEKQMNGKLVVIN